jgi:hypothetical protein
MIREESTAPRSGPTLAVNDSIMDRFTSFVLDRRLRKAEHVLLILALATIGGTLIDMLIKHL